MTQWLLDCIWQIDFLQFMHWRKIGDIKKGFKKNCNFRHLDNWHKMTQYICDMVVRFFKWNRLYAWNLPTAFIHSIFMTYWHLWDTRKYYKIYQILKLQLKINRRRIGFLNVGLFRLIFDFILSTDSCSTVRHRNACCKHLR